MDIARGDILRQLRSTNSFRHALMLNTIPEHLPSIHMRYPARLLLALVLVHSPIVVLAGCVQPRNKSDVETQDKRLGEAERRLGESQALVNSCQAQIGVLRNEADELRKHVALLERNDTSGIGSELSAIRAERDRLAESIGDRDRQLDEIRKQASEFQSKAAANQALVGQLSEQLAKCETDKSTTMAALDRCQHSAAAKVVTPTVVESKIDGEFEGWSGETVFKLLNGQIWQQSSYSYTYHYAFMPEVLIYPSGSGYKMRVNGVDGDISVTRLK
jgi:hypothetical protein